MSIEYITIEVPMTMEAARRPMMILSVAFSTVMESLSTSFATISSWNLPLAHLLRVLLNILGSFIMLSTLSITTWVVLLRFFGEKYCCLTICVR